MKRKEKFLIFLNFLFEQQMGEKKRNGKMKFNYIKILKCFHCFTFSIF